MQPINYLQQVADPFTQSLQGYKIGAGMAEIEAKKVEAQRLQQQQQLAAQEQEKFFANPNPTMKDAAKYASLLSSEQSKAFLPYMEGISKEKQQGVLKSTGQILSALQVNPQTGIKLLQDRALAERNSGDEEEAALFDRYAEAAADPTKGGPGAVFKALTTNLAYLPGSKEMFESIDKALGTVRAEALAPSALEKAGAEAKKAVSEAEKSAVEAKFAEKLAQAGLNKSNWDIKNLQSQIGDRSQRLALDKQTTAATVAEKFASINEKLGTIPADTRKLINETAVIASTSKQAADQMNDLAQRIEGLGGYGAASQLGEFAKSTLGIEGYDTALRQEYTRLRNQAAIKSLPPGPATDKDIEIALRGFPKDTSDSKNVAQFLRGMAKMQNIDASINNAKTDWLANNNGTLTRAKNTFIAGDYAAKPGETFNDFSQRIVTDVSKKAGPPKQTSLVEQIPTPRTPAPATTVNIRSAADAILSGGR
jgi:hypothetical protein